MARVVLKNVTKRFANGVIAARDINLTCEDKEFIVLVGPSGCGKSTTLRLIAGLEDISEGEIYIGDKLVNDVPPKERDIAMVFQNYALYPHMTVFENMAFGLKLNKFPQAEIKQRVMEAADILSIRDLLERKPRQLSGGQRQRVAVGRAIVRKPKVFLFDEPLSNLDAQLRVQMRAEISKLHTRLQATMIYVTHDQVEAMTMGDRIVIMKDGYIQQIADPITLYDQPSNKFVAGFIGSPSMNFMDGSIIKKKDNLYFSEENFTVKVHEDHASSLESYIGRDIILGIRPEDIYDKVYASNASPDNTITATVEVVEPMGAEAYLYLTTGKSPFIARVDSYEQLEVNQDIDLVFDMTKSHFFDRETGQTIV
ncbi:MAG: sn-glycerol-3-phosphate ABC transporter ATP-binding protein UgpC [Candidatus Firestonebacteria bacterium]|nr:sn-glycerol-3-phosphate ABC transporter ATP-binding protein UgpC [Candidatus Firestonebacteria bacterium]